MSVHLGGRGWEARFTQWGEGLGAYAAEGIHVTNTELVVGLEGLAAQGIHVPKYSTGERGLLSLAA